MFDRWDKVARWRTAAERLLTPKPFQPEGPRSDVSDMGPLPPWDGSVARRLWSAAVTYSVTVAPGASELEYHQTPLAQG